MADLLISILGNASQLKGELDKAGGHVSGFSEKIGKIGKVATIAGGIITAAFTGIVLKTAEAGDAYDKMSLRTGVSVEALSALAYAADISGTSIETIENSLRFLASGMKDTSEGTGAAKAAFDELGISVVDSDGKLKDTVEVMKEAATKLAAMDDKTRQAALAGEIFGTRYGTQLLPLLKEGGKGIEELMEKAKGLNLVVSTESSKAAADFGDRLDELKGSIGSAGREIGDVLIPVLTPLLESITEIVVKVIAWAKENPELIAGIVKVTAVIGVIAAVGGPILMAVSAFSKISGAISAIGTIATGPIGLLILAIGAVVLVWKNWDKIVEYLKGFIDKIKGIFSGLINFLGNIGDKIAGIIAKIGGFISGLLRKIGVLKGIEVPVVTIEPYAGPTPTFHQAGISYVPRKAFYGLDPGERVLTAAENKSYNQSKVYSPTININNPVVRNDDDIARIRRIVKDILDQDSRQRFRQGNEILLGA